METAPLSHALARLNGALASSGATVLAMEPTGVAGGQCVVTVKVALRSPFGEEQFLRPGMRRWCSGSTSAWDLLLVEAATAATAMRMGAPGAMEPCAARQEPMEQLDEEALADELQRNVEQRRAQASAGSALAQESSGLTALLRDLSRLDPPVWPELDGDEGPEPAASTSGAAS